MVNHRKITKNCPCTYSDSSEHYSAFRLDSHPRHIGSNSLASIRVPIILFPLGLGQSSSHRGKMEENSRENSSFFTENILHSERMAICTGFSNSSRETSIRRSVTHENHSSRSATTLVSIQGRSIRNSTDITISERSSKMADDQWATSLDLSDAHHYVLIRPDHQKSGATTAPTTYQQQPKQQQT